MLQFSSIEFWALFVAFLGGFAFLRTRAKRLRVAYVIVFSLFFFYKANGFLMLLLPATALLTWGMSERLRPCPADAVRERQRRLRLAAVVVLNLLPLLYFKYNNFIVASFAELVGQNFSPLDIALPIGISFYTFQGISYAVDVFRGRFTERVAFVDYLFYLSFFPLLLAGPITRAGILFPQLRRSGKRASRTMLFSGLWLVLLGVLKKAVVADYIAQYNNWIFDAPESFSGFEVAMGVVGYTVQIYCDFSGYSDMSIGLAAMLGIRLPDNFNLPYQSLNVTEFWRRWHISLSTWFRDYFYIPLGGNRRGQGRMYLNLFLTMLLAGVWHGASWMFAIWGALHGLALVVHKAARRLWLARVPDTRLVRLCSWLLTMQFVMIAWVFFRARSLEVCCQVFSRVSTDFDWAYLAPFISARTLWFVLVVLALLLHGMRRSQLDRLQARFVRLHWSLQALSLLIVAQLALQMQQAGVQPFIYSNF